MEAKARANLAASQAGLGREVGRSPHRGKSPVAARDSESQRQVEKGGMPMPRRLTAGELAELRERYSYLVNYQTEDPDSPIDPLTYADSNGDHLLHIAAQRGDLRTVELLLDAGVNIDQKGDMGCTALHYARLKRHEAVAELLLARGASSGLRNDFGRLP